MKFNILTLIFMNEIDVDVLRNRNDIRLKY